VSNFLYNYGNYTHEVGEIYDFVWQQVPHTTKRLRRDTALYRITLRGRLLIDDGCTWTNIRDKISDLMAAYRLENDRKFSVTDPDGNDTAYVLDPNTDGDILSGPYLVNFTYPHGSIEEFVVKRDFTIVLECVRVELESQIIEYEEHVSHYGNCMREWTTQNVLNPFTSRSYTTWDKTTQTIVQKGHSVGFDGYYAPGWLYGWQTLAVPVLNPVIYEHPGRRVEVPGKPIKMGNQFVYYPASWMYVYESLQPQFVTPV